MSTIKISGCVALAVAASACAVETSDRAAAIGTHIDIDIEVGDDECKIGMPDCPPPPPPPPPSPCTVTIIDSVQSPLTIEDLQPLPWEHVTAQETYAYHYEADLVFSPGNVHFTIVLPGKDPGGLSDPSHAQDSYCQNNILFLRLDSPTLLTVYASDELGAPDPDPIPTAALAAAPARRQKEGKNVEAGGARSRLEGSPGELPPGSTAPGAGECSDKYEWEVYAQASWDNRDIYTGPAAGGDDFLLWSRDAVKAAGKAVKTVDNIGGVLPVATQWGEVVAKPDTNRKHMSLGHGNKSLAVATTNDRLVDNSANTRAAGAASGKVNDVEWFHCCTGARFTVKVPDGQGNKPWPDQLLRAYWRAMPVAVAKVAGYDQVVGARKADGRDPAKLLLAKDHNKRVADGSN